MYTKHLPVFASWDSRGGDSDKVMQKINHLKTLSRLGAKIEVKRSIKTDDFIWEKKNDLLDGPQHQGWDTTTVFDWDNNIAVFCLLPTWHICF